MEIIRKILKTLEENYNYPVDIEFTANFTRDDIKLSVNLLQCRPLQTKGLQPNIKLPSNPDPDSIVFDTGSYFMGGSISQSLNYVIYVDPAWLYRLANPSKIRNRTNRRQTQQTDMQSEKQIRPSFWGQVDGAHPHQVWAYQ